MELVNKPTIDTYQEEAKVLKVYIHTALKLSGCFAIYKMKPQRERVLNTINKVNNIMKLIKDLPSDRPNCS